MATPKRKRNPAPPDTPFEKAANRYIKEGGSERGLLAIIEYFGPQATIGEIDAAAIEAAIEAIGGHLTTSSAETTIARPIRTVLNHAFDTGHKRGDGKPPARWLTPDEVERLIAAASKPESIGLRDPHRRTLQKIAFMLGTGAVPGEVIIVEGSAQDRQTGAWQLPGIESILRPRTILPPQRASQMIGGVPLRGPAFLTPDGQPYVVRKKGGGQMAEAFGQIRAAAGLGKEVTPATCRTTWAIWLYAQARDLDTLVALGGWAGPRSPKPLTKLVETGLDQWLYDRGWDFRDSIASFHAHRA